MASVSLYWIWSSVETVELLNGIGKSISSVNHSMMNLTIRYRISAVIWPLIRLAQKPEMIGKHGRLPTPILGQESLLKLAGS